MESEVNAKALAATATLRRMASLSPESVERERLRAEVISENVGLARALARRYRNRGESDEDLEQVAMVGLIKAVDRFEPGRDVAFIGFATPTILGEIRRYFRDCGWMIRVSRRQQEMRITLRTVTAELSQRLHRSPTPQELAGRLGTTVEEVLDCLEASQAYASSSIYAPVSAADGELTLADTLGDTDDGIDETEYREALKPLIEKLPERERTILLYRFYGNLTQSQIADKVGLSQMHVSRLITHTCERLRGELLQTP
jgi:RNA polymerase sigma-B factor